MRRPLCCHYNLHRRIALSGQMHGVCLGGIFTAGRPIPTHYGDVVPLNYACSPAERLRSTGKQPTPERTAPLRDLIVTVLPCSRIWPPSFSSVCTHQSGKYENFTLLNRKAGILDGLSPVQIIHLALSLRVVRALHRCTNLPGDEFNSSKAKLLAIGFIR